MKEAETRVFYKIRIPENEGKYDEWHSSNNGTNKWSTLPKVKGVLTRGIMRGWKGTLVTPFTDFEIHKFTETVYVHSEIIDMEEE